MLDTKYNHKQVEENKYSYWLEKDYFTAGKDKSKEPYCIVIPPPNVVFLLHLVEVLLYNMVLCLSLLI